MFDLGSTTGETILWEGKSRSREAAGKRSTASVRRQVFEKIERAKREWTKQEREIGRDEDERGIHSPRVMRSSPPGGMNEPLERGDREEEEEEEEETEGKERKSRRGR